MVNMLALPQYQVSNGWDFTPINNALQSNQDNLLAQNRLGLQRRQVDLAERADTRAGETHGLQMAQMRRQSEQEEARMVAGRIQYIQGLPPEQRMAAWKTARQQPGFRDLPAEFDDFNYAAPQLLGKANEYMNPIDRQAKQAQISMHGAHADLYRAQAAEERRKASIPVTGFKDGKQLADVEEGIRKEYSSHAKPYFEMRDAFTRIQQSAANPSAAGDLALIFNYMKMLDPGSVVREGEFATAQNAAGIDDRIKNIYNRLLNGERLNPEQRQDFINQAQGLFGRAETQYGSTQQQYRGLAERKGIDPRNVILDYSIPKTEGRMDPPAGPKADRVQTQQPAASAAQEPVGARRTLNGKVYTKTPQGWVAQ
jgi:hypothetical protein